MSYADMLKDPRWEERRKKVLAGANYRCEACNADNVLLHAHHKLYRMEWAPWDYPDEYYECLCESCHTQHGVLKAALNEYLIQHGFNGFAAIVRLIVFSVRDGGVNVETLNSLAAESRYTQGRILSALLAYERKRDGR